MYLRMLSCALCAAVLFTGTVSVPVAGAAMPGVVSASASMPGEIARREVLYHAKYGFYATVKTDAWVALLSEDPDAAAIEFLRLPDGGLVFAKERAQNLDKRNIDFLNRLLETHTRQYSPEVYEAASNYLTESPSKREEFCHGGGYEAAKARDLKFRADLGEQKRALVEEDRRYIRMLAQNDPGAQVRFAASYAVRAGATDDDLTDFFAWGWAHAARLDIESFRERVLDQNQQWLHTIARLITDAEAAEKAARETEGEAGKEARDKAAAAWRSVGTQASPAQSKWEEARDFSRQQAETWRAILLAAQQAQNPNWNAMIDPAKATEADWENNRSMAVDQAAYWESLLRQALEGEQRVKNPS
ncbi:hypothetical protein [Amycolatopsis sp. BJA-103]|uniref:hypothetical protein n=1 Tax=unclassified Amycolatopsis TaxID=2618356 RepID=UPI0011AF2E97|nr:hypothetical protein [Amycolatopsis sp. BJA-103]